MDVDAIFAALISKAQASGKFEVVQGSEPKNAPGAGVTGAFWFTALDPVPAASGLSSTTIRFVVTMRIYVPSVSEPADAIDPQVISAAAVMFTTLSGAFTLGGLVREIDLLGEFGTPLSARPGWLPFDNTKFRTIDITIPMIIDNEYTQAA
jgi:hypothetical protein